VLLFHGGGSRARGMLRMTGMPQVARRHGFHLCAPDAVARHWNDGRCPEAQTVDDVSFVRQLIDHLGRRESIDPQRIYAVGMSNGGFFALHLGQQLADRLAGVAAVAASLPVAALTRPDMPVGPARPLPLLLIHGTQDPVVPYAGGPVRGRRRWAGTASGALVTAQAWAHRNGVDGAAPAVDLAPGPDDARTRSRMWRWPGTAPVALCEIEGGGHTWPGGRQYLPRWLIGATSRDWNAGELIWRFFRRDRRPRTTRPIETPVDADGDRLIGLRAIHRDLALQITALGRRHAAAADARDHHPAIVVRELRCGHHAHRIIQAQIVGELRQRQPLHRKRHRRTVGGAGIHQQARSLGHVRTQGGIQFDVQVQHHLGHMARRRSGAGFRSGGTGSATGGLIQTGDLALEGAAHIVRQVLLEQGIPVLARLRLVAALRCRHAGKPQRLRIVRGELERRLEQLQRLALQAAAVRQCFGLALLHQPVGIAVAAALVGLRVGLGGLVETHQAEQTAAEQRPP
jgi:Poly(3-hydroxybutyrate) depolymerase